jgi:hypothetical protein
MRFSSYLIINVIFLCLIGVIFGYSYFFYPNDHPVSCEFKRVTGKDCPSCGLSRAYSAYTRGEIDAGRKYNSYSIYSFIFLLVQFIFRGGILVAMTIKKKEFGMKWIKMDVILTSLTFALCFYKFLLL